jgi:hypothetical protein
MDSVFSSSIFQTLLIDSINFFILIENYIITASPPAASIALCSAVNL